MTTDKQVAIDEVPDLSFDAIAAVVQSGVQECRENQGDDQAAHGAEDRTWEAALTWLAENGDAQARSLASEALRTQLIDFERWCA